MNRKELDEHICRTFNVKAEYLWKSSPSFAVYRRADNAKWFAVIMDIPKNKLGIQGDEKISVVNVKCETASIPALLGEAGIYPAYHMSKAHWVSAALEGSLEEGVIKWLIDTSFELTSAKTKRY